ncbi:SulP family inorganic anion transporter [Nitrospirota bacterium]
MTKYIHGLRLDNLRGDIYGGLTAAVVALPLAMAFGVASGAGPIAGLYGAIFVGLFAALFGGTPAQISGPTGPMTVVMAGIFVKYTAYDPVHGVAMAFTVVMMGGIMQILFGVFKIGRYINLVPHPVISGFMSGIGVIIILIQIGPLIGHPSAGNPLGAAMALPGMLGDINHTALALGVLTLGIVYLLPANINRIIPAPLLALFVGTIVLVMFMPEGVVSQLGNIPTSFPRLQLPVFDIKMMADMFKSALILALLGSIDSLLTSLVADSVTRTHHDSDRELIGQGIGNTVAGLFGGLPGAGATMRTVVNIRTGGQTPISGVLHALTLLAVILGAGSLAQHIPHVVLAGILIKVGTDIIDWDFLRRARYAPKISVGLMFVVLFLTVFVDLITSVAVGMIVASFLFLNRMAQYQLKSIKIFTDPDDETPLGEEEQEILKSARGRILVYHLSGPLSFGAAKDMAKRLGVFDGYDALILDFADVPMIDTTTGVSIEDMINDALSSGKHVFLSGADENVRNVLDTLGVFRKLKDIHIHATRLEALREAAKRLG